MHLKKKLLGLTMAAMTAASLAAAPSASAAASVECAFSGLAGNITPGVRAVLGPNGPTGGSGTYEFNGRATCTGVDHDGTVIRPTVGADTTNATIASNGSFVNTVCGTGTASGNTDTRAVGTTGPGTYVNFDDGAVQDITQVTYNIQFVSGVGAISITRINNAPATAGGNANIIPHSGDCVFQDVTAFDVAGGFGGVQG
jgi:hypothetical protein